MVLVALSLSVGCLSRPVDSEKPSTKDFVGQSIRQSAIDKVDLLFDIDNSASMGDKQAYLSAAVPDLLTRLLSPYCVDTSQNVLRGSDGKPLRSDPNGNCAQGTPEFKPVHDMHIGVVTSSLGARGGDIAGCSSGDGNLKGELRNVGATSSSGSPTPGADAGAVAVMAPSNFLSWFPNVDANQGNSASSGATAVTDDATLEKDFADVITGVGQDGCGIESQLESWYRFLIQPDPYDSIQTDSSNHASWQGVDATILKQRHDFLRPDSLVAIITLTDENDSEVDVRSLSGSGYQFMRTEFDPPKGTKACDSNPNDPACTSCQYNPSDPGCPQGADTVHSASNDWGYNPNLRHVHTKAKYGVDFQFPIRRYVDGLSKTKVPDRNGEYPTANAAYAGEGDDADCTNPLFAASLPDGSAVDPKSLCNLPIGSERTPDLIFFGVIGGVPNQLLHYDGTDDSLTLTAADWTKILGNDPETFDYAGIDPHMVESYAPRAGLPAPTAANDADPISGREWITDSTGVGPSALPNPGPMPFDVDREYACIFPLAKARDCTDPANAQACDCPATNPGAAVPAGGIPPVCDASNPTSQVAAKVYPTPRELLLAHKMGDQGIASSLCPIDLVDNATGDDPKYGYRPAVAAIISRLKHALASACLPQPLDPDANGDVSCLVLEALPPSSGSCASKGLSDADPKIAAPFASSLQVEPGTDGGAATTFTICEAPQLVGNDLDATGSCTANNSKAGWCYVTGNAAGAGCAQAVKFSAKGNPGGGVRVQLQCILQTGGASSSSDGG
jgi:hypothetical protein